MFFMFFFLCTGKTLVGYGAGVDIEDEERHTPLREAKANSRPE